MTPSTTRASNAPVFGRSTRSLAVIGRGAVHTRHSKYSCSFSCKTVTYFPPQFTIVFFARSALLLLFFSIFALKGRMYLCY